MILDFIYEITILKTGKWIAWLHRCREAASVACWSSRQSTGKDCDHNCLLLP